MVVDYKEPNLDPTYLYFLFVIINFDSKLILILLFTVLIFAYWVILLLLLIIFYIWPPHENMASFAAEQKVGKVRKS
jgi:hypothetical protein